MALFGNNQQIATSKAQVWANRYRNARMDLLCVVILTAVNLVLLATDGDTYFVFSASIPYAIASLARYMCGLYPEDWYEGGYGAYEFYDPSLFYMALAFGAVIVVVYLLCFIFSSKNRVGWMIAGLSLFSLDTLFMLWYYGITSDMVIDLVFHVFCVVMLACGVYAHFKLKRVMQEEQEQSSVVDAAEEEIVNDGFETPNSPILRAADMTVKARVLLEVKVGDHVVTYRRVKRVNELVIDGFVYDEYSAVIETPHFLTAKFDGHTVGVGYNGTVSYAVVDGQQVASKVRWY